MVPHGGDVAELMWETRGRTDVKLDLSEIGIHSIQPLQACFIIYIIIVIITTNVVIHETGKQAKVRTCFDRMVESSERTSMDGSAQTEHMVIRDGRS